MYFRSSRDLQFCQEKRTSDILKIKQITLESNDGRRKEEDECPGHMWTKPPLPIVNWGVYKRRSFCFTKVHMVKFYEFTK